MAITNSIGIWNKMDYHQSARQSASVSPAAEMDSTWKSELVPDITDRDRSTRQSKQQLLRLDLYHFSEAVTKGKIGLGAS